jgi:hypothetical protein
MKQIKIKASQYIYTRRRTINPTDRDLRGQGQTKSEQ